MTSKDFNGKGTIDLLNIDYDDVLHLYRGWRHAEGQLKDKNKEMNALKDRIKQLQDSHVKFRGQIQALESVKELTITLQTQLSVLQEENRQLVNEKVKFTETTAQAETLLIDAEVEQREMANQIQSQEKVTAALQGRYEELARSHKELEFLASEEQTARMSAESRLKTMEENFELLKAENKELRQRLDISVNKMSQCDKELAHAAKHLSSLTYEVSTIASLREKLNVSEAEKKILETDITRILRLLEQYSNGNMFGKAWEDSERMSFVGKTSSEPKQDTEEKKTYEDEFGLSPQALIHLRKIYPAEKDPYPLSTSMEVITQHTANMTI